MLKDFDVSKVVRCYKTQLKAGRYDAKARLSHGLVYFHEGQSSYLYEDKTVSVSDGSVLFLPEGVSYGIRHDRNCVITVLDVHSFQKQDFQPFSQITPSVDVHFASAIKAFSAKKPGYEAQVKSSIYKIIGALQASQGQYAPVSRLEKIKPATDFIKEKFFFHELSLKQIVNSCEYGTRYFCTQFKLATGKTPVQYLTEVRIENAKRMLQETSQSVKEIAYACGFSSEYYFSNLFKGKTGESPREYRKSRRNV